METLRLYNFRKFGARGYGFGSVFINNNNINNIILFPLMRAAIINFVETPISRCF